MDGEESIKMNGTPPVDEDMIRNRKKRTKEGFLKFCQVVLEHEKYDEMIREERMSLTANENMAPSDQITDTSIENSTFDESDLNADGWNANGGVNDVGGIGLGVGGVGGIGEEGSGGGGGGGGGADSFNSVTCFCGKPFAGRPMIECSGCLTWLHMSCAKVKRKNIPEFYFCEKCKATGTATNSSGEEGSGSIVGGSSGGGGGGTVGVGGGVSGGVGAENNSTSSNNTNINLNNNLSTKMINTNPMDLSQLQMVNVKPRKQSKLMSKKSATTNNNNNNNNRMMNSSDNIKNINASDNKFVNKKSSPMNGKLKKIRKMSPTKKFRQQLTTTTTNTTPTTSPSTKALMMNNTATASSLMAQVQLIDTPSTKEQSTNMLLKSPTNNNNNNNNNIYNTAAIETSVSATTTAATTTTTTQQTNIQLITTTPTTPTPPATTANVLENTNGQDGQEKYNSNKRLKVL